MLSRFEVMLSVTCLKNQKKTGNAVDVSTRASRKLVFCLLFLWIGFSHKKRGRGVGAELVLGFFCGLGLELLFFRVRKIQWKSRDPPGGSLFGTSR